MDPNKKSSTVGSKGINAYFKVGACTHLEPVHVFCWILFLLCAPCHLLTGASVTTDLFMPLTVRHDRVHGKLHTASHDQIALL